MVAKFNFSIFKEATWIVAGQMVNVVAALLLIKVLTQAISPQQYGLYSLLMTFVFFQTQVLMGGTNAAIGRYYSIGVSENNVANYFTGSMKLLRRIFSFTFAFGLIIAISAYFFGLAGYFNLIIVLTIYAILSAYRASLSRIQNSARQRLMVAFHNALDAILRIPAVLLLIGFLSASVIWVLAALTIACIIAILPQHIFLKKHIADKSHNHSPKPDERSWFHDIWQFSKPYYFWTFIVWAQQSSARWTLEIFSGTKDVGLFTVMYQLSYSPIVLMIAMLSTFLQPIFYDKTKVVGNLATGDDKTKSWTSYMLIFGLFAAMAGFLLSKFYYAEFFKLFVSQNYAIYSYLMPNLVAAGVFFGLGEMFQLKLQSDMQPKLISKIRVSSGIIGILLNILCVRYYGIVGLVHAIMLYSIGNLALFVFYHHKTTRLNDRVEN